MSANEMEDRRTEIVEARQRTLLNVDRRDGSDPMVISSLGDQRTLWASTGLIANGASKRLYFAAPGVVTGGAIFRQIPGINVWLSPETLVRADTASSPEKTTEYEPVATWRLSWLGPSKTWSVDVFNESGASRDFLVRAEGL